MQQSADPDGPDKDITASSHPTAPDPASSRPPVGGAPANRVPPHRSSAHGRSAHADTARGGAVNGSSGNGGAAAAGPPGTGRRQAAPGPAVPPELVGLEEAIGYRGTTACAVAGITYRQLDYWARTGLVVPSVRDASGSGTQRLYSFRDIVVLKVVKRLLNAGVSLQNIRKAIGTLRQWGEDDLATMTLISDGTTVYECRSTEEVVDLLQGGQGVFGIAISGAFKEIQGSLAELPTVAGTDGSGAEAGTADAGRDGAHRGTEHPQAPGAASRAAVVGGAAIDEPGTDGAPGRDDLAARRARRRAG